MIFSLYTSCGLLPRVVELCKSVFFCIESYPTSTAVLVHGNLYYLFQDFSLISTNPEEKSLFRQHAALCKKNLETSLANFDLLLPATSDNVEALLLGVSLLFA
jgi:hypothetical protein